MISESSIKFEIMMMEMLANCLQSITRQAMFSDLPTSYDALITRLLLGFKHMISLYESEKKATSDPETKKEISNKIMSRNIKTQLTEY
jgi:hypothetical protein